jgi:hypothetical protein
LHVLLVEHGKRCRRCSKGSLQLQEEGPCPLVNFYKDKTDKKDKDEGFDVNKGTKRSRVEDTPQATGKEDMKDYKVLRHLDLQGGLPMQVKSSLPLP